MSLFRLPQSQVADAAAQQNFEQLESELARIEVEPWHNFSGVGGQGGFFNSSVHLDNNSTTPSTNPAHRNVGYRKYPDGTVRLRGVMKCGLSGAQVLQMPPGYRPTTSSQAFEAQANGGAAVVSIDSTGAVLASNQPGNVTVWLFLDGITFDAGQGEALAALKGEVAPGTFAELAIGGTSRKINAGQGLLNFPGAARSSTLTIAHGLGVVPAAVVATAQFSGDDIVVTHASPPGASTFALLGTTRSGIAIGPGTLPVHWIAFG